MIIVLINEIINKVNELRGQYSLKTIPVDLDIILKKEKIEVVEKNFTEYEHKVDKQISGMLYIDGETKLIFVNERDNKERQKFTVAHELGHYFLHGGKKADSEVFVSFRGDSNPRETDANRFAAELLLPDNKVKEEYKLVMFPTASYLADKFYVSRQAMSIKLDQMGLSYIGL